MSVEVERQPMSFDEWEAMLADELRRLSVLSLTIPPLPPDEQVPPASTAQVIPFPRRAAPVQPEED